MNSQSFYISQFKKFTSHYLDQYFHLSPESALSRGNYAYASRFVIPNEENKKQKLQLAQWCLAQTQSFIDRNKLPQDFLIDAKILAHHCQGLIWYLEDFQSNQWNPASYNVGHGFAKILEGDFAPISERLKILAQRLTYIPEYYQEAQKMIETPTKEHAQLAIEQNQGTLEILTQDYKKQLLESQLSEKDKAQHQELLNKATQSIQEYIEFLKNILNITENFHSFRIGEKQYEKKFFFDINSRFSAYDIFSMAQEDKKRVHQKMYDLSLKLWDKYFPRTTPPEDNHELIKIMIDEISLQHTTKEKFQDEITKQIPELEKFVIDHDLLTLDPKKPLVVRKMPAYMKGVAGASISSPGPFDPHGKTYYNVGSLENYSPDESESYLREYNDYMLQILNIHEAIPGHYVQLLYSNKSPSLIKSLFGNGAMIEGWAVYSELMMLENGYGGGSLELDLIYHKWHLRSIINTILDYSVHVLSISKEEGLKLLIEEGFQEEKEAHNKWKRATLSQVQLVSYYTGFKEIYLLRQELKDKQQESFNLKTFHEKFLSFGSSPVKYIREMML